MLTVVLSALSPMSISNIQLVPAIQLVPTIRLLPAIQLSMLFSYVITARSDNTNCVLADRWVLCCLLMINVVVGDEEPLSISGSNFSTMVGAGGSGFRVVLTGLGLVWAIGSNASVNLSGVRGRS